MKIRPGSRAMAHERAGTLSRVRVSIVGVALDHDRTVMVPVADRTRDNHGVVAAVVAVTPAALAIVIEGDRAVVAVVKTVAFVIDDDRRAVVIVMPVMRPDHDIGLGRGSNRRGGDTERQGSKKHCFHCSIPNS
jgi:hypothetical protein